MSNSIRQINKLFVGNLPWTVSHNELKKYFSEFGQISNAIVMFDRNTGFSKGFGFVTFQSREAVEKVLNTESHVLDGGRVNVQPSDSQYNRVHLKMSDNLENLFQKACDHLPSLVEKSESTTLLKFYALFKQATVGPCNIGKPSWFDMSAKSKYNAWKNLEKMTKHEAMEKYIQLLNELDSGWQEKGDEEIDWDENEDTEKNKENVSKSLVKGWVNVSSMLNDECQIEEKDQSVFDYAKDGNLPVLSKKLEILKDFDINQLDSGGTNCLHWACDRGHLHIVKYLVEKCGADINCPDSDGDTPLDYAKAIDHQVLMDYFEKSIGESSS